MTTEQMDWIDSHKGNYTIVAKPAKVHTCILPEFFLRFRFGENCIIRCNTCEQHYRLEFGYEVWYWDKCNEP